MKINHRHYILLILALLSLTVSLFGYILIYKKTITQATNYSIADKEVKNENVKKQNEKDLIKVYDSTKDTRDNLPTLLVREGKVVDFIEMVEKIGDEAKIELEISTITNDKDTIKAKVNAKGSWAGIMTALTLLENLPLVSTLNNLRLDSVGELSKKDIHTWNMTVGIEVLTIK